MANITYATIQGHITTAVAVDAVEGNANNRIKRRYIMIIAIPAEKQSLDSGICVSFGRAPYFCVYDTDTQNSSFVENSAAESEGGAGIKAAQNVLVV